MTRALGLFGDVLAGMFAMAVLTVVAAWFSALPIIGALWVLGVLH